MIKVWKKSSIKALTSCFVRRDPINRKQKIIEKGKVKKKIEETSQNLIKFIFLKRFSSFLRRSKSFTLSVNVHC